MKIKYLLLISSLCSARVFAGSSQYCETERDKDKVRCFRPPLHWEHLWNITQKPFKYQTGKLLYIISHPQTHYGEFCGWNIKEREGCSWLASREAGLQWGSAGLYSLKGEWQLDIYKWAVLLGNPWPLRIPFKCLSKVLLHSPLSRASP